MQLIKDLISGHNSMHFRHSNYRSNSKRPSFGDHCSIESCWRFFSLNPKAFQERSLAIKEWLFVNFFHKKRASLQTFSLRESGVIDFSDVNSKREKFIWRIYCQKTIKNSITINPKSSQFFLLEIKRLSLSKRQRFSCYNTCSASGPILIVSSFTEVAAQKMRSKLLRPI